ncbi:hypothetical protein K438DRAFT_1828471 [Mycena galopus ATCC 62051]|nr:hypothetical protein K438DRAFT_1828471 [Mycena galopus ATCC 62051]
MGDRNSVVQQPAPLESAVEVPQPTLHRRSGFQCPEEDQEGASLTNHGTEADASSNGNGSTSTTTFTCTYKDGAGECSYSGDGTFELGSSACPAGTEASIPSSTAVATQTQTQTVTQTAEAPPPSTFPTAASSSTPPPTLSSLSATSSSNSQFSSTLPSSSAPQSNSGALTGSALISQPSNTGPPVVQSTLSSGNSLDAGTIAGIVIGVLAVLILPAIFALYVRRKRRRQRATALAPESYLIVTHTASGSTQATGSSTDSNPRHSGSISTVAQTRQEFLTSRLRAVQKELEALQATVGTGGEHLEQAMQQNEALRARIRMLEREMQSQWGLGLTDSPPGYLD